MRSEKEITEAIDKYADTVKRICLVHLKNSTDTEDIFQNVFLKFATSTKVFENDEHEKAWIIRVTINACKDYLKSFFRSKTVSLEDLTDLPASIPEDHKELLEAVLTLPQKYRIVIYLYFFEEYTGPQISELLGKNLNTIYTNLSRAKDILREKLKGESL